MRKLFLLTSCIIMLCMFLGILFSILDIYHYAQCILAIIIGVCMIIIIVKVHLLIFKN